MDLRLVDYALYIAVSIGLTVWVGTTLFRNGRPFLVSVFKEDGLADSVNRLLVVGFYLVNFGAAAILINTGGAPDNVADMLKQTVTRVGVVLLVLGFMHFNNVLILRSIRRRDKKPSLPPNLNPYQWTPPAPTAQGT
jgi:hypothetical protein